MQGILTRTGPDSYTEDQLKATQLSKGQINKVCKKRLLWQLPLDNLSCHDHLRHSMDGWTQL